MSQSNISVPYLNTYWVVHGRFLAGEHPTELDDDATITKLTALLDGGIRTFVDLTLPSEIKGYHHLLCTVADARRVEIKREVVAQIAKLRSRMPCGRNPSPQTSEQVRMVENWDEAL